MCVCELILKRINCVNINKKNNGRIGNQEISEAKGTGKKKIKICFKMNHTHRESHM